MKIWCASSRSSWTKCSRTGRASSPPGGESYETLRERVRGVLRGIIERDEDTLIVAHNGPLTTAMILLLDMPDTSVNNLWFEQGTWSCVEIERGRARLKYFNK